MPTSWNGSATSNSRSASSPSGTYKEAAPPAASSNRSPPIPFSFRSYAVLFSIQFGKGYYWVWIQEIKTTANRRESAIRARQIGFADPHSRSLGLVANQRLSQALVVDFVANPFDPTAPPSSGPFGQILSAPRRLP